VNVWKYLSALLYVQMWLYYNVAASRKIQQLIFPNTNKNLVCYSYLLLFIIEIIFFASFVLTGYHMQRIIFSSSLCVVDLRLQNLAFVISQPSSLEWILGYYGLTRVLDLVSPYQSQDKFLICRLYPLALRFYLNTLVLRSRYRVLQRTTKATGITAVFASILTYS